uniref:Uncharacterized protein n=1 Tax=Salvator merianae TaxID=96440 RepID=A0A8D0CBC5_SALMN
CPGWPSLRLWANHGLPCWRGAGWCQAKPGQEMGHRKGSPRLLFKDPPGSHAEDQQSQPWLTEGAGGFPGLPRAGSHGCQPGLGQA